MIYALHGAKLASSLRVLQHAMALFGTGQALKDPDGCTKDLYGYIDEAREVCEKAGMAETATALEHISDSMKTGLIEHNPQSLSVEARHALDLIHTGLTNRLFLSFSIEQYELLAANKNLLGEHVVEAFPSAALDINEAAACLAFDCDTAAVFHLMRVVEWGLRALANDLGIKRITTVNKAGKKPKYQPLSYSEWEKILDSLHGAVNLKVSKLKRGADKQRIQEFYYPVLQDIRGIKDAWRNHVMHSRAEYNEHDARAVFEHVKRLMSTLATRVSEV